MAGTSRHLHVQTRRVLFLVWSVTLVASAFWDSTPTPCAFGKAYMLVMHDCGPLGPRADATVRSTSPPKIDVFTQFQCAFDGNGKRQAESRD